MIIWLLQLVVQDTDAQASLLAMQSSTRRKAVPTVEPVPYTVVKAHSHAWFTRVSAEHVACCKYVLKFFRLLTVSLFVVAT